MDLSAPYHDRDFLSTITALSRLTFLDITTVDFSEPGSPDLGPLGSLTGLRRLELWHGGCREVDVSFLSSLKVRQNSCIYLS